MDLNRRTFAQESLVYPPGQSTIVGGKKSIKPLGPDNHGLLVLTLQGSLHRGTTLSSRTFQVEGHVSGEPANLPGIRLLFPSNSKTPAWLFSSPYWPQLRLGQYVGSKMIAGIFSASGNKVYLTGNLLWRRIITFDTDNSFFQWQAGTKKPKSYVEKQFFHFPQPIRWSNYYRT